MLLWCRCYDITPLHIQLEHTIYCLHYKEDDDLVCVVLGDDLLDHVEFNSPRAKCTVGESKFRRKWGHLGLSPSTLSVSLLTPPRVAHSSHH